MASKLTGLEHPIPQVWQQFDVLKWVRQLGIRKRSYERAPRAVVLQVSNEGEVELEFRFRCGTQLGYHSLLVTSGCSAKLAVGTPDGTLNYCVSHDEVQIHILGCLYEED